MTRESSPPLEARTVFTTGANSGIGLATVLELARRGFRSVGSVRSKDKARALERAAGEAGVEVETVLLDVTDASGCRRVIDELRPWGTRQQRRLQPERRRRGSERRGGAPPPRDEPRRPAR